MPGRPAPARRSPGPYRPASRGSPLLWRSGDRRSRLRRWPPASRRCRCGPAVRHRDDAGDDVLGDDYRQRGSNSGTTQCHCQPKSVAAMGFCSPHRIGPEASMVCPRRALAGFSSALTPMGPPFSSAESMATPHGGAGSRKSISPVRNSLSNALRHLDGTVASTAARLLPSHVQCRRLGPSQG